MADSAFTPNEAKGVVRIPDLWRILRLYGNPGESCRCPFHEDHKVSFRITNHGGEWKCSAGCGSRCAVVFLKRALKVSSPRASATLVHLAMATLANLVKLERPSEIRMSGSSQPAKE
jgi:hypothetical protein